MKKIIILICLSCLFLFSCQGGDEVSKDEQVISQETKETKETPSQKGEEIAKETDEEAKVEQRIEDQAVVKGATIGSSRSNYLVDRGLSEEYGLDEGTLNMPKILFETESGKNANKEIEELIKEIEDKYKADFYSDSPPISSEFSVYQNDKWLSVMINVIEKLGGIEESYYIYNFKIPSGEFLSDEEILKEFGFGDDEVLDVLEEGLFENQEAHTLNSDNFHLSSYQITHLAGNSFKHLWREYDKEKNNIYLDEEGGLYSCYLIATPAQSGTNISKIPLKINLSDNLTYSKGYIKMARALDIDIEKNMGLIIYLGEGNDESSIKKTLTKLYPWQTEFLDYKDPFFLPLTKDINFQREIIGQEYYLLMPKWKNAIITMKELELIGDNLQDAKNPLYEDIAMRGPVLLSVNMSDLHPNAEITIRYRDEEISFSPFRDLVDGTLKLPDEIVDAEGSLDWEALYDENAYSYFLLDLIKLNISKE